ncbi:MAG: peroxidase-related enzyme [Gemmatimonadaceae bacterium]
MTSWIPLPEVSSATGALADAYARVSATRGSVGNILRVHATRPAALLAHLDLYRELMFSRSELTRPEREMIASVVSSVNGCHYCMHHHGRSLRELTRDSALVEKILRDPRTVPLEPRWRVLADLAILLTERPAAVREPDVQRLREFGLSDAGVHDAVAIIAYFNYVNRLAEGLHVPLEPEGG